MKPLSFIEWVSNQILRDDATGIYARAIFDDFEKGHKFRLVDSACPSRINTVGVETFEAYCRAAALPPETVNVLILGNAMAALEYNVGLLSGTIIQHTPLTEGAQNSIRRQIAQICDLIPAIVQDMESIRKTNP